MRLSFVRPRCCPQGSHSSHHQLFTGSKDSANERKERGKPQVFRKRFPECSLILWKDSANERKEKEVSKANFVFLSRVQPFLSKDSANERKEKEGSKANFVFLSRMHLFRTRKRHIAKRGKRVSPAHLSFRPPRRTVCALIHIFLPLFLPAGSGLTALRVKKD